MKNETHSSLLRIVVIVGVFIPALLFLSTSLSGQTANVIIKWNNNLKLPACVGMTENKGLAGVFSGITGNNLIIAGGANFPDNTPWNGGHKTWWSTLYHINLDKPDQGWNVINNALPEAVAYGVSVTLPEGLLCIGGCGEKQCFNTVYLIRIHKGKLTIDTDWPSLPVPLANAAGTYIDGKIYIAGGQEKMDKQQATGHLFLLDLKNREKGWQTLPTWPGEPRGYAVMAAQTKQDTPCIYLFSGRNYNDTTMNVLTDAYLFNTRLKTWQKLEPQFPVMAGTAIKYGKTGIILLGGVPELIPGGDNHPGFDNTVRLFNTETGKLTVECTAPYPIPVTTVAVSDGKKFYISSGEVMPGIRTPEIRCGQIEN